MGIVSLLALTFLAMFLVATLLAFSSRKEEERAAAWRGAAARLGLTERSTDPGAELPKLRGMVDGHAVEVETIFRSENDSQVRYTVVRSQFPESVPEGFSLTQASFVDVLRTVMGRQDIPIADSRLDKKLVVQGRHPVAVQELLDIEPVRRALRRFFRDDVPGARHSRVEGRDIIAERKGLVTDAKLNEMINGTVGLVSAVTGARVRAWKDIATRHGLTFERIGPVVRVVGARNGGAVRIESWDGKETQLSIAVPGLEPHIRIEAGGGGFVERDQILGGRVCITGEPTVLAAQFGPAQLDVLRGDLMQVFETWPATMVANGMLRLSLPGEPYRTIAKVLRDLGMLADALGQRNST